MADQMSAVAEGIADVVRVNLEVLPNDGWAVSESPAVHEYKPARPSCSAVHTGARVVSLARPGEVLVTRTVRDLVAGSGIEFADRGVHQLKGVPGEWGVLAVMAGSARPVVPA
jgi:hypothetical protein